MLVFDFDGTVTAAELEGQPFRAGYIDDLASLAGVSTEEILPKIEGYEAKIRAAPGEFGWTVDGRIVAPATVDPYLRMMPVARMLFDDLGVFSNSQDRDRLLDNILYKYNYTKTKTVFRAEAEVVFTSLLNTETYVVTNSHTEPVQEKFRLLFGNDERSHWWTPRVFGRAKKYLLDPSFSDVPESIELPGLARPIYLRRAHYFKVLQDLLTQHGQSFDELTVIGDIFELDLALPLELGARIGLMKNEFTPSYESDFVLKHPRAELFDNLQDAASWSQHR